MVSERIKVHAGLVAALIVLIACLALLIAGTLYQGDLRTALPGSIAPDFSLRDAGDHPVELSDLRGNVVIVYFRGESSDESVCPTSNQSDTSSAVANAPKPRTDAPESYAGGQDNLQTASAPELSQLSEMCRKIHSPRVKVLDLESTLSLASLDPAPQADHAAESPVQTLLDPAGDVAREYKIDQADAKPTFFVIDPSGIIRYRGNSLQVGGASATDQLRAPATQPSSCPQVIQALLSSAAFNVALSPSGRF